jgi:cytochrome c oxidase cbb3-type subunit 3
MAIRGTAVGCMNWKRHGFHFTPRCFGLCAALVAYSFSGVAVGSPQEPKSQRPKNASQSENQSSAEARRTFEGRCAPCHGLDGRGGERAPNIATRPSVQRQSDAQISRTIQNGVPAAGMPSFATFDRAQINALVNYLRLLQGRRDATPIPGNATNGKTLFFGGAKCSECHSVEGQGGFIAADLSIFGRTHPIEEVREAITNPGKAGDPSKGTVVVTALDGQKYSGVVRNEDNFSLQLQTIDGGFHLFAKSDLGDISRRPESLMPANYGSTLSRAELDDLIGFLMKTAADAKPDPASSKKSNRGEEEE